MKEFKQIFVVSNSEDSREAVIRVLYLDVAAMTDADRAMWDRVQAIHKYLTEFPRDPRDGAWLNEMIHSENVDDTSDEAAWLGLMSADTLAPCFVAAPAGAPHSVTPPGTITGVYVVNVDSVFHDCGVGIFRRPCDS